jgi:hypothetical protein
MTMSDAPQRRKQEEIERLLVQLRDQVAQLRRLEQASRDGTDLHTSRHAIAALHWRLARIVGNYSGGDHSVAV